MTISKKGLRSIAVNRQKFYWKFNDKVFVFSNENKNCFLTIDIGWFDKWLHVNVVHKPRKACA